MTTKILALTDALGNLVRFKLLPGHRYDTIGIKPLLEGVSFDALIADKAFDSNVIIDDLDERGAKIVISQHPRRIQPLKTDADMYKRSEEHTSELQSREKLVCRLLHEKKKQDYSSIEADALLSQHPVNYLCRVPVFSRGFGGFVFCERMQQAF